MRPETPPDRVWIDKQTPTAFRALNSVANEVRAAAAAAGLDRRIVVVWVATTIGAFNRVSILSKHPVRARKERGA
ncbi:hypothetical protein [Nocardia abscessus]|uniref:hypothetical protein n=1 Tax=Nocardia abscessus TaxID=120957 RepID=UPI002456286F|nr:hypothetical protein [Nocardia abscessus]